MRRHTRTHTRIHARTRTQARMHAFWLQAINAYSSEAAAALATKQAHLTGASHALVWWSYFFIFVSASCWCREAPQFPVNFIPMCIFHNCPFSTFAHWLGWSKFFSVTSLTTDWKVTKLFKHTQRASSRDMKGLPFP